MKELTYLLVFTILSIIFAVCSIIAGYICGYKNVSNKSADTYECGMNLFSDAKLQFDIKYFNFAILFLIFEVQLLFLYPFAISFSQFDLFILLEIFVFLGILLLALFYALKKYLIGDNQ